MPPQLSAAVIGFWGDCPATKIQRVGEGSQNPSLTASGGGYSAFDPAVLVVEGKRRTVESHVASSSARVSPAGHFERRLSVAVAPLAQFWNRDHVCCPGGDFHADVAEAGIIIEHFLLANAFQAQPSRFENARCLNRDGMADAVEVIETHYAFADRHNRYSIIFVFSSPDDVRRVISSTGTKHRRFACRSPFG
jgi:hypothetical protein